MIARVVQIGLSALVAGLTYWGWSGLNLLRGTVFFEYRYVLLFCAAVLALSLAQAMAGWIARLTSPDGDQ